MKPCPNCENVGWYARQVSDDEYEQEQCEFCYTVEDSVFNVVTKLQSTITAQEEKIKRYQALMTKHILGKCPQCNYIASWPVCTKCGTPYPDGMNELGEK